jgi:3',5'-cyclic-AMP phosphodiesterase
MAVNLRDVTLLQITDTHLHAALDSRMRGVTTQETFESVLAHVSTDSRWPPDAIVATGDIVQDESRAGYERFKTMLAPYAIPVLCVPGNHDDPNLMHEVLALAPFQVGGEIELGAWTLLLLDTFVPGEDAGALGPETLAWLSGRLTAHRERHVLICMHHHPLPMGSAWLDGVALRDAEAFLAIVDAHSQVRGVLWGHVHQSSDRERRGVRYLSTPSTCSQFLPGSAYFALDDRPPGARWLRLRADGGIDTEVCWISPAAP